ncbi:Bifunctional xylanase/deacetylase [Fusarium oxysporum f. sp. cubense race 1]|uniref:Bifunctional xylanase/deacetylase n=1 Tax=Fusarium oxysporum f. sp. cubense (strain race 1) TaxID=1229664 RepID=N4UNN7_FUSC1|nr:Bifunctional xylanase/deacetylase [Fusarium oxysporum f. sp. cubense race 1]
MKSITLPIASLVGFSIASPWSTLFSRSLDRRQAGRCGTGFGTVCGRNECCSSAGWCGTGYLYCSAPSCQIEYGPGCDANVRPGGPDTTNAARPKVGSIPYGQAIYRCNRNGDIALTYDDGPYTYTEDLLNLLQRYNAKATFYITGRNLGKGAINDPDTPWPGLIWRMVRDGHQIASHTWSHQRLTTLSRSKFWNQMIYNEIAFADILGYFPTYMRPPYSASNTTTDAWLNELGYHITYFNLDTEGYLHDSPNMISTSKQIWDNTVEGRSPATNKWLHIEHDPVYQTVYNLTEYMLRSIRRNNFTAVTVGQCLQDPPSNWYRTVSSSPSPTSTSSSSPTFPATANGRCGSRHGGATCRGEPNGETCCSQNGWCGGTSDHCGRGCQPVFGTCRGTPEPAAPGRCGAAILSHSIRILHSTAIDGQTQLDVNTLHTKTHAKPSAPDNTQALIDAKTFVTPEYAVGLIRDWITAHGP